MCVVYVYIYIRMYDTVGDGHTEQNSGTPAQYMVNW